MEKALGILKQVKELSGCIKYGAELPLDEDLDEAIEELEEAMKPKSCDGCKHDEEMYCLTDMNKECYMCSRNMADRYVPKES